MECLERGIYMNSGEIEKLKKELLHERERYSLLISMNTGCFFEYDLQTDCIVFTKNEIIPKWNGIVIEDVSKKLKVEWNIYSKDIEKVCYFFHSNRDATIEFRMLHLDGSYHWYLAKGGPVGDFHSSERTFNGCISDIDVLKKEQERKERESKIDPLTKVLNFYYTKKEISDYLLTEGKYGSHTMILIDIDEFNYINAKLGNIFGNAVLINIVDQLQQIFYTTDVIGRVGGDEFLILLKNEVDKTTINEKIDQIMHSLSCTYIGEDPELRITCCIGIATYPVDGKDYDSLFLCVDRALCQARRQGRKHAIFYNSSFLQEGTSETSYFHILEQDFLTKKYEIEEEIEITNFAFEIMSKTSDINSAINLLLERIGRKFGVNCVYIMEKYEPSCKLYISYLWDSKLGVCPVQKNGMKEKMKECLNKDYFNEHGVYAISNIKEWKNSYIRKPILYDINAKSVLQCGFYDAGDWKNLIGVEVSEDYREWTSQDIHNIQTITQVISFYLYKLRVSKTMEDKLSMMQNYDVLTGLPTLYKFKKDVRNLLYQNTDHEYAIIYTDISGFKNINDIYGYKMGDQILCDFATFITTCTESLECVARVSADIFIGLILFQDEKHLKDSVKQINESFIQQQREKNMNFNIVLVSGACVIDPYECDITKAIDNANIARKRVKGSNKSICSFYDHALAEKIKKELEINNCMENALINGEFKVFLQPKLDLKKNCLAGAEALVRWKRSNGYMPPNDFIPLFEKNGFIIKMDFYIYEEVCKQLKLWLLCEIPIVPISINVSRIHLNEKDFVCKIKNLVEHYEIPHHLIELELTESIFLDNTNVALEIMRELRKLGFGVSIDDFGAGYSSLNLLKDMTTDVLKLDKEFFRQGEMKKEERIIVSSIVSMAKQLNMKVLSEGVETQKQIEFLKEIDCDFVQGYLYAKPMSISDFELFLSCHRKIS